MTKKQKARLRQVKARWPRLLLLAYKQDPANNDFCLVKFSFCKRRNHT